MQQVVQDTGSGSTLYLGPPYRSPTGRTPGVCGKRQYGRSPGPSTLACRSPHRCTVEGPTGSGRAREITRTSRIQPPSRGAELPSTRLRDMVSDRLRTTHPSREHLVEASERQFLVPDEGLESRRLGGWHAVSSTLTSSRLPSTNGQEQTWFRHAWVAKCGVADSALRSQSSGIATMQRQRVCR